MSCALFASVVRSLFDKNRISWTLCRKITLLWIFFSPMVAIPPGHNWYEAGILERNPVYAAPGLSLEQTYKALASGSEKLWDDTLKTNVSSVYFTVVAFLPLLGAAAKNGQGRGSVILTGSVAGIHWSNEIDTLAYQASKASFHCLCISLTLVLFIISGWHYLWSFSLIEFGWIVLRLGSSLREWWIWMTREAPLVKAIQTSVPLKRPGKDTILWVERQSNPSGSCRCCPPFIEWSGCLYRRKGMHLRSDDQLLDHRRRRRTSSRCARLISHLRTLWNLNHVYYKP